MADQEALYTSSWRVNKSPRSARWLARFLATALALVLVFWFGFVLLEPFSLPTTYLVVANPPDYMSGGGQRYQLEATLGTDAPPGGIQPLDRTIQLVAFGSRSKSLTLRNLDKGSLGRINSPNYRQQDVLIVVLSGVGLVAEDGLKMRLARDANSPNATTIDLRSTLERIRKLPAGLKLLLFDLQPEYYSAPDGQIANTFPERLREQISRTGDKGLWAICSHAEGELPRVSTLLDSSHFLLYARNGISGQADKNGDLRLTLAELYAFFQERFAFEDLTAGIATGPQTPLLLWGGGVAEDRQVESALLGLCSASPDFSVQSFVDQYEASLEDSNGESASTESSAKEKQSAEPSDNDRDTDLNDDVADEFTENWQRTEELLSKLGSENAALNPMDFPRPWIEFLRRLAELQERYARNPKNSDSYADVLKTARFALQRIYSGRRIEEETFPQVSAISQWTEAQQRLAEDSLLNVAPARANELAEKFLTDQEVQGIEQWLSQEEQENVKLGGTPTLERLSGYRKTEDVPLAVIREDIRLQLQVDRLWQSFLELNFQCISLWSEFYQHQVRARRLIADRVGTDWHQKANLEFSIAQTQLFEIEESLESISAARSLSRRLSFALPEYLRLHGLIGNQAAIRWVEGKRLKQLIEDFGHMNRVLAESPVDVKGLAFALGKLESGGQRILEEFGAGILTDSDRTQALTVQDLLLLSRSPIFSSETRSRLFQSARDQELASWRLLSSADRARRVERSSTKVDLKAQIQFEALLARALVGKLSLQEQEALDTVLAADTEASTQSNSSGASFQLERFYKLSSNRLDRILNEKSMIGDSVSSLSTRSRVAEKRSQLEENMGLARVAPFSVAGETTAIELASQLREVCLLETDQLLAVRQSIELADANVGEMARALSKTSKARERIQGLVPKSLRGPNLVARVPGHLAFSGNRAELNFSLSAGAQHPLKAWVILEYASQEFALKTPDAYSKLYSLHTLRDEIQESEPQGSEEDAHSAELAGEAARIADLLPENAQLTYPIASEIFRLQETSDLQANQSVSLKVEIEKLTSRTDSCLVMHVLTEQSLQRFVIEARVPEQQSTTLVFNDTIEYWKRNKSHLELYPLPNSSRVFHPVLRNNTQAVLKGSLEIGVLQGPLEAVPSHALSDTEWREFSRDLPQLIPVATSVNLEIPPQQEYAIRMQPDASPTGENEAEEDRPLEFQKITPHGLLFVVTEEGTGRTNLHHLAVTPQRPSRVVEPALDFDAGAGRLTVRLQARAAHMLPSPNLRFHVELLSENDEVYSKGDMWLDKTRPSSKLELFAPRGRFDVVIDMGDYERAFRYSLSSEVSVQSYKTPSQFTRVRIESPVPGATFKTPLAETSVRLKVDAPPGAFPYPWNASDFVEVGIDKNRDRRLEGDAVVRLRSDRQVSLAAALGEDGLHISNTVRDFRLRVPTDRMINTKANVLARLVSGSRSDWSEVIPVLFDGEAPKAETVLLPAEAEQDKPLLVSIFPETDQLSKISQVEVLIDELRLGVINDESEPVFASQGPGNQWQAELDVSKLALGSYDVLVRLGDEAGNVGEIQRTPVKVVPPVPEATSKANKVIGRLVYRQRPIANEVVELFAIAKAPQTSATVGSPEAEREPAESVKTDALGRFQFRDLSPGNYQLRAKSVIKNRPRIASQEITVRGKPAAATSVVLEAK